VPHTVLVNPELEAVDESVEEGWEGCLSVPGMRGLVPRYKRCAIAASISSASRSTAR
jgi:peptide deformylase